MSRITESSIEQHTLKLVIHPAPGGDAVDVALHRRGRERPEVLPGELDLLVYGAEDAQPPGGRVDAWSAPIGEHGPVVHDLLAGR